MAQLLLAGLRHYREIKDANDFANKIITQSLKIRRFQKKLSTDSDFSNPQKIYRRNFIVIISDLDHLKTIVEAPNILGGYENIFYENFLAWLEETPVFQNDVDRNKTHLTDVTTGEIIGEALTANGKTKNRSFVFASATVTKLPQQFSF